MHRGVKPTSRSLCLDIQEWICLLARPCRYEICHDSSMHYEQELVRFLTAVMQH